MNTETTITINIDEYRDLVKTHCEHEILLGLLLENTELDYRGNLAIRNGTHAMQIIEQFAPMACKVRFNDLKKEAEDD